MTGYSESSQSELDEKEGMDFDGVGNYVQFDGMPDASQIKTMACRVKLDRERGQSRNLVISSKLRYYGTDPFPENTRW